MAETLLQVKDLIKEYEGNRILDGVNLEIEQGQVVVVVGPSGCGKSTMLRCINALEPTQGGSIEIEGQQISQSSKNLTQLRQKIGMVFQSYELFPHLTVLNNILLAPAKVQKRDKEEVKKEALELLERVGLKDKANSFPRQLSGGQKQRVACARAMVTDPGLVLADEPTGALDSRSARMLLESFQILNREMQATILMVTHDAFTASYAGRVIFIKDGKLFHELRKGNASRREFFDQIMDVVTLLGGDLNHAI